MIKTKYEERKKQKRRKKCDIFTDSVVYNTMIDRRKAISIKSN